MGTPRRRSTDSSARKKWNKIFNHIVRMLRTQQSQLESFENGKKYLEERINLQHNRWISDVNLFKDRISQLKNDLTVEQRLRMVEAAKSELVMSLMKKEAHTCKLKLENGESDLADFIALFDILSQKCTEPKEDEKGKEWHFKEMEGELRRLKKENERLKSKNNPELLAVLSERDFVWNQYKKMESELSHELRSKRDEVDSAKEKIGELLSRMELLQSGNTEKDNTIARLKNNISHLESESTKKNEEISRLSRELELLRMSRSDSVTPVLCHCKGEQKRSRLGGKNSGTRNITEKKDKLSSQVHEKGSRKRKAVETIPVAETPKLFSSSFKVPKLKSPCPHM